MEHLTYLHDCLKGDGLVFIHLAHGIRADAGCGGEIALFHLILGKQTPEFIVTDSHVLCLRSAASCVHRA